MMRRWLIPVLLALSLTAQAAPRPDHVVVVIEENRGYAQIMDRHNGDSYIHQLARQGRLMTNSHGVTHPSQPNYLALFSGSTQGIVSNACPLTLDADNLASNLIAKGLSFASYAQSMPAAGDSICMWGAYRRKHNPVANWQQLSSVNLRFEDFPRDFSKLPAVSFVIPDQNNDMHDGSFEAADEWLKQNIRPYVEWASKHNSLLILTWDEDNGGEDNRIVTILTGPMVKTGTSDQRIDHYNVLRTLLDMYGLPALGASREAEPIQGAWN